MTLSECVEFVGVSKSYLYKLTSTNKIPFYRPAVKLIYFKKSEIIEWVFAKKVATLEERTIIFCNKLKPYINGQQK